jgi:hypothetical protein
MVYNVHASLVVMCAVRILYYCTYTTPLARCRHVKISRRISLHCCWRKILCAHWLLFSFTLKLRSEKSFSLHNIAESSERQIRSAVLLAEAFVFFGPLGRTMYWKEVTDYASSGNSDGCAVLGCRRGCICEVHRTLLVLNQSRIYILGYYITQ